MGEKDKAIPRTEKYTDKEGREVHREYMEPSDPLENFNVDRFNDTVAEIALHGKNERERKTIQRYLNKSLSSQKISKLNMRLVFSIILVMAYINGLADWVKDSGEEMFIKRTRVLFQKNRFERLRYSTAHHIYQSIRSVYTANFTKESPLIEKTLLQVEQDPYYQAAYLEAKKTYGKYFPD